MQEPSMKPWPVRSTCLHPYLSKALVIEGDTRSVLALTKLGKALNTTYQTVFEEIHQ